MSSLSRHLRESDDHGGLAFHPGCPVCRGERLRGRLSSHRPLGPRVSAAAVALLIGSSTLTGPLAAAQVPDDMTQAPDGTEEAADGTQGEEGDETIEIPDPEPPLPAPPPVAVEAPEVEPVPAPPPPPPELPPTTPEPPATLPAPAPEPPATSPTPILERPQPAPVEFPAPAEPPASAPAAPQPAPAPEPAPAAPPKPAPAAPKEEYQDAGQGRRPTESDGDKPALGEVPMPPPAPQTSPPVEVPAGEAPVVPPPDPTTTAPVPAARGDQSAIEVGSSVRASTEGPRRVHVVKPGETLWSIAKALVGDPASPARISAMVDHLWRLNADRIRSGQPDLIRPGERLILP